MAASKREFKNIFLSSKPVLFVLLLILIWAGLACVRATYKKQQMAKGVEVLKARNEQLKEDMEKLNYEKTLLDYPSYLEKEAKIRFNLKKEGEEVVILSRENNSASVLPAQISASGQVEPDALGNNGSKEKEEPNWKKWWKYFFQ
jgi:cell division protein FtsB